MTGNNNNKNNATTTNDNNEWMNKWATIIDKQIEVKESYQ